ncbi:hypothetical protein [Nocardia xishanensis]
MSLRPWPSAWYLNKGSGQIGGLGAKVMAMHERKLAMYPDWAELMETIPEVCVA